MNKHRYVLIGIVFLIGNSLIARSSDISNILLQPGGYYAFPYKKALLECKQSCDANWYKHMSGHCADKATCDTYYDTLCDRKKHFLFQVLGYGCFADKGFNTNKQRVPLSDLIFGSPFQIQDANLAARLAAQGALTLSTRPGMPPPFGATSNEQYIALLAPTDVIVSSEFQETGLNITALYHARFPGTQTVLGVLGILLPIRSQLHRMNIRYENGSLFAATAPQQSVPGQSTLTQFFSYFEGIDDFFTRGVLAPKELAFTVRQRKINIGDIAALTALDVSGCSEWFDACLIGMQWVFPTGSKQDATQVWPIELGNGGSYQFEPFINIYANVLPWINPVFYVGGRLSTSYTGWRRIPQLKTGVGGQPLAQTNVLIPPGFQNYIITPGVDFAAFDTTVLQLADQRVSARIHPGAQMLLRVGNFFEQFLIECLDLGIFYDVYTQRKERIGVLELGIYNTDLLVQRSATTAHIVSWRLGYTHNDVLQAYIGSQHVVAGKNVPQDNKIYASLAAYF